MVKDIEYFEDKLSKIWDLVIEKIFEEDLAIRQNLENEIENSILEIKKEIVDFEKKQQKSKLVKISTNSDVLKNIDSIKTKT